MKDLRYLIAIFVVAVAGAVFLLVGRQQPEVTIKDATLVPMGSSHALLLTIDNPGGPTILSEIKVSEADAVTVSIAPHTLAIPGGSSPKLAMDGAHAMVHGLKGDLTEGRLIPVTLAFENRSSSTTRAKLSRAAMSHGQSIEVSTDLPHPEVSLSAEKIDEGFKIVVGIDNFRLSEESVDGAHRPRVGHGHLYLNGLKLQRLYTTEAFVGALPAGQHELEVVLNTNDHRTYLVNGEPLSALVTVTVE